MSPSPLSSLIRESSAKAEAAAGRAHEMLANPRIVLFGSGGLGRLVLRGLRARGMNVESFADNNRERWGQTIDGVPVHSPEDAVRTFGDALFIISVWNASPRRNHADILGQLRALGCRNVLSFADAFRDLPETFLPYYAVDRFEGVQQNEADIEAAYALLADDVSREVFRRQIEWRITNDFEKLGFPVEGPQYFPADVYRLRDDEQLVDCGAFDGDTLQQFLRLTSGKFAHYWALEPDERNLAILQRFVARLDPDVASRITCLPYAASDRRGQETFDASGSASSSFSATGTMTVNCAPLDELVPSCTLIKVDVEGAEPKVLEGARGLITRDAPILALAAYHTQAHLWEIPLQVRAMNPSYRFFLREHNAEAFDVVLYAVPPSRGV